MQHNSNMLLLASSSVLPVLPAKVQLSQSFLCFSKCRQQQPHTEQHNSSMQRATTYNSNMRQQSAAIILP